MTQLDAMKELADKVGTGEPTEIVAGYSEALDQEHRSNAVDAYLGSLDAAKALHEAVLGDMWGYLIRSDREHGAFANVMTDDFVGYHFIEDGALEAISVITSGASFPEYAALPARAWLLAIIRAKISELESEQ